MSEEKHIAIFKGIVKQPVWNLDIDSLHSVYIYEPPYEKKYYTPTRKLTFRKPYEILNLKEIWTGEISRPVLEVGEEIYINDLDLIVKVERKYRTTNDEVVYETDYIIDIVNTDKTKESRLNMIERWFTYEYPNYTKFEELKYEFKHKSNPIEKEEQIEPWKPSWEKEEKKEKTWLGWLRK